MRHYVTGKKQKKHHNKTKQQKNKLGGWPDGRIRHAGERTGHIPTAPALTEGALLVCVEGARGRGLGTRVSGVDRSKQNPGNTARAGRDVALGAIELGALEAGLVGLALVEQVEDGALHGIERDDFDCLAFVDGADVDIVVVVKSPGMLRGDLGVLEARLGEDE